MILEAVERGRRDWIRNSTGDVTYSIAAEVKAGIADALTVFAYDIKHGLSPMDALKKFANTIDVPFSERKPPC
jgi:hypothetical protein